MSREQEQLWKSIATTTFSAIGGVIGGLILAYLLGTGAPISAADAKRLDDESKAHAKSIVELRVSDAETRSAVRELVKSTDELRSAVTNLTQQLRGKP